MNKNLHQSPCVLVEFERKKEKSSAAQRSAAHAHDMKLKVQTERFKVILWWVEFRGQVVLVLCFHVST